MNLNHKTLRTSFFAIFSDKSIPMPLGDSIESALGAIKFIDDPIIKIGCNLLGEAKQNPNKTMGYYEEFKTNDFSFTSTMFLQSVQQQCVEKLESSF